MINVLCVESSPEEWACYSWPDQMQVTTGSTKEEATQAFLVLAEVSAEECRFFGPLIVTAYYTELANDGWEVYAYADTYYAARGTTLEQAKVAFITLWNDRTNSNITDENVDWVLE